MIERVSMNTVKCTGAAFSPSEATWIMKMSNMRNEQIRMEACLEEAEHAPMCETFVGYAPSGSWPNDEGWRPVCWPGDDDLLPIDACIDERYLGRTWP